MSDTSAIGAGATSRPGIPPGFGRRRRGVWVTTAAAAALGLSLVGTGVAGVAGATTTTTSGPEGSAPTGQMGTPPGGGKRPTAFGTVKSVGSDTFTLTERGGTVVTVAVTSSTTYRDKGVTSATLADVTVGEHVAVFGTEASGTITANSVAVGLPGAGPGGSGGKGPNGKRPSGRPSGSRPSGTGGPTPTGGA